MPYKRKKWSPFTASGDYTREQKDDFYDIIKEREERDSKDSAKRDEDMYTHGLGIEAQEGGGSVWKKTDDKEKKKKKKNKNQLQGGATIPRPQLSTRQAQKMFGPDYAGGVKAVETKVPKTKLRPRKKY